MLCLGRRGNQLIINARQGNCRWLLVFDQDLRQLFVDRRGLKQVDVPESGTENEPHDDKPLASRQDAPDINTLLIQHLEISGRCITRRWQNFILLKLCQLTHSCSSKGPMAVRKVIVSDTGKAGYGLKRVTLTTARTPSSWVAPDPMMPRSNHIESLFGSM